MAILQPGPEGGLIPNTCIRIRQKLGKDTGRLGAFEIGNYENGADTDQDSEHHGIYQIRITEQGRVSTRLRFPGYKPVTTSPAQEASREKLRKAVIAWRGLTDSEKLSYNKRAVVKKISGYLLFIKEYMLS